MKLDRLEQVQNQMASTQKKAKSLVNSFYTKGFDCSQKISSQKSFQHPASMSIYNILRNSLGDSEKLLSYSIGKVDEAFLDEASDCLKDHINTSFDLNEQALASKLPTANTEKVVEDVLNSYRNGLKDGLHDFIKTTTAGIASQLVRIAPKVIVEYNKIAATNYSNIDAALIDMIGVEYEVLTKDQKKKLEGLYKTAFDLGFKTVTPETFASKSTLVYQMLKSRVDSCPYVHDEEFVASLKAGNSKVMDVVLKASDFNAEDFAFDVYSKVFIDGVYNVNFGQSEYSFTSNTVVEFVRSSGYADGIEAAINQIAPKVVSEYVKGEM